eukprot:7814517-Prorocentrum_lima.AAC.1
MMLITLILPRCRKRRTSLRERLQRAAEAPEGKIKRRESTTATTTNTNTNTVAGFLIHDL